MTVRYSSASASAAGSTGCPAYCRQALAVALNPRPLTEDDLLTEDAACAGSLRASFVPEPGSLCVKQAG